MLKKYCLHALNYAAGYRSSKLNTEEEGGCGVTGFVLFDSS